MVVEFRIGGTGNYGNYAMRKGRQQSIKLDREMRDTSCNSILIDNGNFGLYAKATGGEYEPGFQLLRKMIFPRWRRSHAPIKVGDKVMAEAGDLLFLEDDTYG